MAVWGGDKMHQLHSARTRLPRNSCNSLVLGHAHILVSIILLIAGMIVSGSANAAPQASGDPLCMDDLFPGHLNCTANDVAISGVAIDPATGNDWITIKDDGCAYPGDTVDFDAVFEVFTNSVERFDIGVFFATDGDVGESPPDGALTGACTVATLPTDDPDALGPLFGLDLDEALGQPGDLCGDINKGNNPMFVPVSLTGVQCADFDNDGFLNLPNCVSWRQKGANDMCTVSTDAYPGAPSKCRCDEGFNVPIVVPPAKLLLDKSASVASLDEGVPTEVVFNMKVTNPGIDPSNSVALKNLKDDIFGDLTNSSNALISSTTCNSLKTRVLKADGSDQYACSFKAMIVGDSGTPHKNIAEVDGMDMRGNTLKDDDDAVITFNDKLPVIAVTKTANPTKRPEPGGSFEFTVTVKNNSNMSDPVTIDELMDDIHGDITQVQGTITATNCVTGQALDPGQTYTCKFSIDFLGKPGDSETDTVTAKATDDEGNQVSRSDFAKVEIENVAAAGITVTKKANPTSVDEPGANVTFTVTVKNDSTVDYVTIDSMMDDVHGNITSVGGDILSTTCTSAASSCYVGSTLAPQASCSCSFTSFVGLDASAEPPYEKDTVTVKGTDDDGESVENFASALVNVNNVLPSATVAKSVKSAVVTYTVVVTNTSAVEDLTLNGLNDDKFGDLTDGSNTKINNSTCNKGVTILKGKTYTCQFDGVVDAADSPHTNKVTATVGDNDGSAPVTPSDTATVSFP